MIFSGGKKKGSLLDEIKSFKKSSLRPKKENEGKNEGKDEVTDGSSGDIKNAITERRPAVAGQGNIINNLKKMIDEPDVCSSENDEDGEW